MKKMIIIGLCLALTTLQGFAFGGGGGAGLDDNELYFAYNEKKIIKIFDNPEEAAQYQWVLNKFKYEEASFKKFSLKLEHGNSSDEEIKESMISFKNAFICRTVVSSFWRPDKISFAFDINCFII